MNWNDYIEFTRTTAIYPKELEFPYLVLGLVSELQELSEQPNSRAEIGDVAWYVARLADAFEVTGVMYGVDGAPARLHAMNMVAGKLAGLAKKFIRDGEWKFYEYQPRVMALVDIVNGTPGIESILDENVAKLKDRKARGVLSGNGDSR